MPSLTRRRLLQGAAALGGGAFATRVVSAAPSAEAVTPALIEAAKKEGKVVWYTSLVLTSAEKVAKQFEAAYPGVKCEVLPWPAVNARRTSTAKAPYLATVARFIRTAARFTPR